MKELHVFAGPTLSGREVLEILPHAIVHAPLERGDLLDLLRRSGVQEVVVIDGVFSSARAAPVSEFVEVLLAGVRMTGVSSLGAVRAAECAIAGMAGFGQIFEMYRAGELLSDAEVAVRVNPSQEYRAETLALIDVRWHISELVKRQRLVPDAEAEVVEAARTIHFLERSEEALKGLLESDPHLAFSVSDLFPIESLKRRDALEFLQQLAGTPDGFPDPPHRVGYERVRVRYHRSPIDFGLSGSEETAFAHWILGAGIYQKYLWPMLIESGMRSGMQASNEPLRSRAARELSKLVGSTSDFVRELLHEMDVHDDLHAEVILWRSHLSLSSRCKGLSLRATKFAEEEAAVRHGFSDWAELLEEAQGDSLYSAIPLTIVRDAVRVRARALSEAWERGAHS